MMEGLSLTILWLEWQSLWDCCKPPRLHCYTLLMQIAAVHANPLYSNLTIFVMHLMGLRGSCDRNPVTSHLKCILPHNGNDTLQQRYLQHDTCMLSMLASRAGGSSDMVQVDTGTAEGSGWALPTSLLNGKL